ncbi:MAG: hypothetical protein JKY22_12185 [Flavobacteriaceae bacterium]|nr:hypothetical protein [Flavobacteriaceae bacterium]PCJ26507.1 MAG: hypothetical protein COA94_05205 [Rickettsiales bacterium]
MAITINQILELDINSRNGLVDIGYNDSLRNFYRFYELDRLEKDITKALKISSLDQLQAVAIKYKNSGLNAFNCDDLIEDLMGDDYYDWADANILD